MSPSEPEGTSSYEPGRKLRIAWLGPAPRIDGGGVPGVAALLLEGLADLGHQIDCFFPSAGQPLPPGLSNRANVRMIWGTSRWEWHRWYSRTRTSAFLSGLAARAVASVRLRGKVLEQHRLQRYDLIYQFSTIESPGAPGRLLREIPLVLHPETHSAGELRALLSEWRTAVRCGQLPKLGISMLVLLLRSIVQRRAIARASLLVCISAVFRDHMAGDYGVPLSKTVVIPNPVLLDRFDPKQRTATGAGSVLVLGRIAARKGIQDVVALCQSMATRKAPARVRVVGGPSLWSDYTPLLGDLPSAVGGYEGSVAWSDVPRLLSECDVLVQASRYEPFALTVAEALAAGVPVVATSEVGAIEGIDRSVASAVPVEDIAMLEEATLDMIERVRSEGSSIAMAARAEAEQNFAPQAVCGRISAALERLLEDTRRR